MSFFEPKEEVMNLVLTPYGRELLSKGLFKPVYYTFHDDGIVYDLKYAQDSEDQNDSKSRILYENIQIKPNKNFNTSSYDYTILNNTNLLGTSELGNQNKPAWSIKLLDSNIVSVTGSNSNNKLIVSCSNIETNYYLSNGRDANVLPAVSSPDNEGNFLRANVHSFLLDLQEINVDEDDVNFEAYLYLSSSDGLKQLNFIKEKNYVVNNILLDESELATDEIDYTPDLANTYFIVEADNEIKEVTTTSSETQTYRIRNDSSVGDEC